MRHLATIREVSRLVPISGADKIEKCLMKDLGWEVVVKKNELHVGEKVVYFEIDSAIPCNDSRFEFLRESSYKRWMAGEKTIKECFRLKTRKLRGVISQGLIIPISVLTELSNKNVGDDVTSDLNVEHYDELNDLFGKCKAGGGGHTNCGNIKGPFPHFIPKSDQERIQNLMSYFDEHKETYFTGEAKYDGSSCTVYMVSKEYDNDQFGVCSRNNNLKRPCNTKIDCIKECLMVPCYPHNPLKRWINRGKKILNIWFNKYKSTSNSDYWNIVNKIGLEQNMREFFKNTKRSIAIQGEYCGPGVNRNRDNFSEHHLFIYDVYDVDNHTFVDANERHNIIKQLNSMCGSIRKFEEVDTRCENIKIFQKCPTLQDLLKFVDQKTLRGNPLEGIVFKSVGVTPYFSFKCINNSYLLKEKDE